MNIDEIRQYVQVEECGARRANTLLQQGFTLLHIGEKAWEQTRKSFQPGGATTFIRHDLRYVIGRKVTEPPFPAWEEYTRPARDVDETPE